MKTGLELAMASAADTLLSGSRRSQLISIRLRRSLRQVDPSFIKTGLKQAGEMSNYVERRVAVARRRGASSKALVTLREQLTEALSSDGTGRVVPTAPSQPKNARIESSSAASNLRSGQRQLAVVTSAALPWMTGTSVNPLLRAAHLAAKGYATTLVLPWLLPSQQPKLFPESLTFVEPAQQEEWIRAWLSRAGFGAEEMRNLKVRWYPAIYEDFLGAAIQRSGVDITQIVPQDERDVAILDEPEHLCWYHQGAQWNAAFRHVVGVLHTNYQYYARNEERSGGAGDIPPETRAIIMGSLNNLVCRAHVDVTVKLSDTLEDVPGNCLTCNVHGVRSNFLEIGAAAAALTDAQREASFGGGAYLLGKALWTKGYKELFEQLRSAGEQAGGKAVPTVDTYGSGRDEEAIRAAVESGLPVNMNAGIDHAHASLHAYRVFVNPSTSEVLCTATAEALAMGKKVVIPDHPSNTFFKQFANAILYRHREDLIPELTTALRTPPAAMTPKEQYLLSWAAATERLLDAALLPSTAPRPRTLPITALAYRTHRLFGNADDYFRENSGATPSSGLPGGGLGVEEEGGGEGGGVGGGVGNSPRSEEAAVGV